MYSSCTLIKLPVLNLSFHSNKKWVPTPTPIYTDFVSSVLVPSPSLVSTLISSRISCPYFSIMRARKSTYHSNAVFCSMIPSFQITIFHKFLNPIDFSLKQIIMIETGIPVIENIVRSPEAFNRCSARKFSALSHGRADFYR